jgi:hypothetical protein
LKAAVGETEFKEFRSCRSSGVAEYGSKSCFVEESEKIA